MERKIFLGKYRVAATEMALGAVETSDTPASDQVTAARVYRGEEIDSGRDVSVEVIPALAFQDAERTQLEDEARRGEKANHINIPTLTTSVSRTIAHTSRNIWKERARRSG